MKRLFKIAILSIATIAVSCSTDDGKLQDDVSMAKDITVMKNVTKQLELTDLPDGTNDIVVWSSGDSNIASVDSNGRVNGMAKGTASIMAKTEDGEYIEEWTVTVEEPAPGDLEATDFVITVDAKEITIPISPRINPNAGLYNYNVDWDNDGIADETGITEGITHTFETAGEHTIRISGSFPAIYFSGQSREGRAKLISVDQWGTQEWLSMRRAFFRCENVKILAVDTPNLSKVTNMELMFSYTNNANPDVSNWDVSNVISMRHMFSAATAANPDVSHWDVSNVVTMNNMFRAATSANPDVSNWDVSNVTNMEYMFAHTDAANPNVSNWDVSNVTTMKNMFFNTSVANPDVSNWTISNVTDMNQIFGSAASFSEENYESLLISFANQSHKNNVVLGVGDVKATSAEALAARQTLVHDGWRIFDGS